MMSNKKVASALQKKTCSTVMAYGEYGAKNEHARGKYRNILDTHQTLTCMMYRIS